VLQPDVVVGGAMVVAGEVGVDLAAGTREKGDQIERAKMSSAAKSVRTGEAENRACSSLQGYARLGRGQDHPFAKEGEECQVREDARRVASGIERLVNPPRGSIGRRSLGFSRLRTIR
jgi:hypothetical protein